MVHIRARLNYALVSKRNLRNDDFLLRNKMIYNICWQIVNYFNAEYFFYLEELHGLF